MKIVIRNIINIEMKKHFAFRINFLRLSSAVSKHVCLPNCDDAEKTVVEV